MLDYISQIEPLESAGKTDAEIASYYNPITSSPIPCAELKVLLEESGLVSEDPVTGNRVGSLVDHYAGLPNGTEKSLLGWFISHVFGRGVEISSDEQPRAGQVALVVAGLPAGMAGVVDSMYALSGGKPYESVTAADVASVRDAYDAEVANSVRVDEIEQLKAEIENTYINPAISDGSSSADQVRANIKANL